MTRNCPFCSRRLEGVTLQHGVMHCCANCSVVWRPGAGISARDEANTLSRADLRCPDCRDRRLIPMPTTSGSHQWRCIACHGRLVRVVPASVAPPAATPSSGGGVVEITVEFLASAAEVILHLG